MCNVHAELNLIDGGTARGTTAVADADGLLHNDGGTMRLTTAATFKTYFQEGISTAYDDLTAGDAAVLITTSSGNITIDAAADDSDIILKGTDGGADTTFLTIDGSAAGAATFNSTVAATGLVIGSTAVTTTPAELNLIDGGATVGTTAIADGDGLLINDAGTMRVSTVQTLAAYLDDEITAMPNLVTVGAAQHINNTCWYSFLSRRYRFNLYSRCIRYRSYRINITLHIGITAMDAITTGDNNTAQEPDALGANTTGADNTAVGYNALTAVTTGEQILLLVKVL